MNMQQLENQSTANLLALYNSAAARLGKPKVNRFADRKTALKRTESILKEQPAAKAEKPAKEDAKGGAGRMTFNFPAKDKKKALRTGTKRAAIFEALQGTGSTFDEVVAVVQAFDKEKPPQKARTAESLRSFVYEAIRLLHIYSGYGLKQDSETGKIRVTGV